MRPQQVPHDTPLAAAAAERWQPGRGGEGPRRPSEARSPRVAVSPAPRQGGRLRCRAPPARLPLREAAACARSLSLARSRPDAAGRGKAAAPFGRGPESSVLRDSGSSFAHAAAMSALAKASGALKSVDYEVFGRVQGKDGRWAGGAWGGAPH